MLKTYWVLIERFKFLYTQIYVILQKLNDRFKNGDIINFNGYILIIEIFVDFYSLSEKDYINERGNCFKNEKEFIELMKRNIPKGYKINEILNHILILNPGITNKIKAIVFIHNLNTVIPGRANYLHLIEDTKELLENKPEIFERDKSYKKFLRIYILYFIKDIDMIGVVDLIHFLSYDFVEEYKSCLKSKDPNILKDFENLLKIKAGSTNLCM